MAHIGLASPVVLTSLCNMLSTNVCIRATKAVAGGAVSGLYFRVRATDVSWAASEGGSLQALWSIEMYETSDATGTDYCRTGTATASESYPSNPPSLASDGDPFTYWQNGFPISVLSWWRCQFLVTRTIRSVIIKPNTTYYAKAYALESSTNGTTWTTVATRSTSGGSGVNQTFTSIQ